MKEERNKNLTNSELTWLTGCCLVSHISLSWTRSQQGGPGCPLRLALLLQEDANGFPRQAASPVKSNMRCSEFQKWRPKPNFEGSSCIPQLDPAVTVSWHDTVPSISVPFNGLFSLHNSSPCRCLVASRRPVSTSAQNDTTANRGPATCFPTSWLSSRQFAFKSPESFNACIYSRPPGLRCTVLFHALVHFQSSPAYFCVTVVQQGGCALMSHDLT